MSLASEARGWTAAIVALTLVGALVPAAASASTWTGRQLSGEAGKARLFGVSCPTPSFCAAVGGNNTVATSTEPSGDASKWSAAYVGAGPLVIEGGGFFNGRQIRGVDCPSASLCVAVSLEGLIYTSTNPTGGASAWTTTDLGGTGNSHLYGVSCPQPDFCAAAASKGRVFTSTDPTGGAASWSLAELGEAIELRGVSCPSSSFCVAVGREGWIASSTNPAGGAAAWSLSQLPGAAIDHDLLGVSCPTDSLCVSGDSIGELAVSANPTGGAAAWDVVPSRATVQITAVDCASGSHCAAVTNNSDVLTSTNPTGGASAWDFTTILPYPSQPTEAPANGMFGVSCPTPSFCAVDGTEGQIFTSSDPLAATPAPPATPVKKSPKKSKKKLKRRPHVVIAARPLPGIEIHGQRTKVRFRFFAVGHAYTRRFLCGLDGSPLRRCASPKTYRVGIGRHVFRVRAVGWTGLRGPQAAARFKVCHPTPHGLCIGAFAHGGSPGAAGRPQNDSGGAIR